MKCFFQGILGAVVGFVLVSFGSAQYSDYRAAAEVSGWLLALAPLQETIGGAAIKQGRVSIEPALFKKPDFFEKKPVLFRILENGSIIIKGGNEGQVLILLPTVLNNKVVWECVGAPNKAIPFSCRK